MGHLTSLAIFIPRRLLLNSQSPLQKYVASQVGWYAGACRVGAILFCSAPSLGSRNAISSSSFPRVSLKLRRRQIDPRMTPAWVQVQVRLENNSREAVTVSLR